MWFAGNKLQMHLLLRQIYLSVKIQPDYEWLSRVAVKLKLEEWNWTGLGNEFWIWDICSY